MAQDKHSMPGMPDAKPEHPPPQPPKRDAGDSRVRNLLSNEPWAQALVENLNRNALKDADEKHQVG